MPVPWEALIPFGSSVLKLFYGVLMITRFGHRNVWSFWYFAKHFHESSEFGQGELVFLARLDHCLIPSPVKISLSVTT